LTPVRRPRWRQTASGCRVQPSRAPRSPARPPPSSSPRQSGATEAAPLNLPELHELAPLLDCLAPIASWGADEPSSAAGDGNATFSFPLTAAKAERARRAGRRAGGRVPLPELQLLRSVATLQAALQALAGVAATGGGSRGVLAKAYAAVRPPVMDLLGLPLAPAPLRLPLLRFALPLLETAHTPFSRSDVQRLLQVLTATLASLAAARADGTAADDGGGAPGSGSGVEAAGLGPAGRVGEVRLALARALARAHIAEASAEA
jgi:hypothetical protein